jgi:hypothetical protein
MTVPLVYGIFLLETIETALSGWDLYHWFASGFGNMDHLKNPYAGAIDVPIIGSIVSGTIQHFFIYRIWVLSDRKSWLLCVIASIVSRLYVSDPFIQPRAHLILSSLFSPL